MAVIRKIKREKENLYSDIYDTPKKLIDFAKSNSIQTQPLNIKTLTEKMGLKLYYEDLGSNISGKIENKNGQWIITINKKQHGNRQRYTIAHELAHYCLHRNYEKSFTDEVFFRGKTLDKYEYQANDFASKLLMPEDLFAKAIKEGKNSIEDLSNMFGVSSIALRIRAKNLGYSGHGL